MTITALIYLIVLVLVIGLAYWVINALPVPVPFNHILMIVIVVIGVRAIIMVLLNIAGTSVPGLR